MTNPGDGKRVKGCILLLGNYSSLRKITDSPQTTSSLRKWCLRRCASSSVWPLDSSRTEPLPDHTQRQNDALLRPRTSAHVSTCARGIAPPKTDLLLLALLLNAQSASANTIHELKFAASLTCTTKSFVENTEPGTLKCYDINNRSSPRRACVRSYSSYRVRDVWWCRLCKLY